MIFLSIWLGSDLPEDCRITINLNRQLMKPEDSSVLISDRPQQGFEVVAPEDVIADEDEELFNESFKRFIEEPAYNIHVAQSDWLRFYYCWKHEDVLYMDCDLVLNRVPEPWKKPLFAAHKFGAVNICLIASCKNGLLFGDFLEETKKFPRERGLFYGWLNTQVDKTRFDYIPINYFIHEEA